MSERSPDDYEEKYMPGEGGVLFRDRLIAPKLFHGLMGLITVGVIGAGVATFLSGDPAGLPIAALGGPAFAAAWGLFSGLRITVSQDTVHVQYGVLGPSIPIDAIESCEAVDYNWLAAGGFGIRLRYDGTVVYNMMGDRGKAVHVVWRDKRGMKRKHLLSSSDPAGLASAINQARAAKETESALDDARAAHGLSPAPLRESVAPKGEGADHVMVPREEAKSVDC